MKDVRDGGNVDESRFPVYTQRRRLGRWLRALAGTCLAVTMAGGSTMVAGGISSAASARVLPSAPSDQCSGPTVRAVISVSCPGAPTLLIPKVGSSQVTLSWTKPASDGGLPIRGYNVYRGISPGGESGTPVNGSSLVTATGYQVTGLTNGTTYYFMVTAVNRAGQGPTSNEVKATPAVTATKPGAPSRLGATPGDGQVTLSWAAPGSDGGLPIRGYNVYQGTSPDGETGPVNGSSLVTTTGYT